MHTRRMEHIYIYIYTGVPYHVLRADLGLVPQQIAIARQMVSWPETLHPAPTAVSPFATGENGEVGEKDMPADDQMRYIVKETSQTKHESLKY